MTAPVVPFVRGTQNGARAWRCKWCGCVFPLAEDVRGNLVPVHPMPVRAFHPVANVLDARGRDRVSNVAAELGRGRYRDAVGLVPHEAFCPVRSMAVNLPIPSAAALAGPPADCARCGHPWRHHIHHATPHIDDGTPGACRQCSGEQLPDPCEAYVEPSPTNEESKA